MSQTNRCSICALNWPHLREYAVCPQCGEDCSSLKDEPMSDVKAQKLAAKFKLENAKEDARIALYREFDKFYEEREVKLFRQELDAAKLC